MSDPTTQLSADSVVLLVGAIKVLAWVTVGLITTVAGLVVWIYNRDRKYLDGLEERISAVPPLVDTCRQLAEQVKVQWEHIQEAERTLYPLKAVHDMYHQSGKHPPKDSHE